jgi:putative hydrolase of the HAD superfamily
VTSPLVPYDDVAGLATLPVRRFLVTSGYRGYQESKIAALGIAHLFEQVLIDTLGEPDRPGKERLFQDVAQRHGWHPRQVLVVGDSAESEITAGNRLGMPTVQVLRPGVDRSPLARYWVAGLGELAGLVERMESSEE